MINETKTATTMTFRTHADEEKLSKAAKVCAKHDELVLGATNALASAEAACAEEPSDANMKSAKAARRALEDAEQGAVLARQHQEKVAAEVAAAEKKAIKNALPRLEAALTVVADDDLKLDAVELAVLAVRIHSSLLSRAEQRIAEIEKINSLRARVGEPAVEILPREQLTSDAFREVAELGLAVQVRMGIRTREVVWVRDSMARLFPFWRTGIASSDPKEFETGLEGFSVTGATADGTPITNGTDRTSLVEEARELLKRVLARRPESEASSLRAPLAAVAVLGLAVASALGLVAG